MYSAMCVLQGKVKDAAFKGKSEEVLRQYIRSIVTCDSQYTLKELIHIVQYLDNSKIIEILSLLINSLIIKPPPLAVKIQGSVGDEDSDSASMNSSVDNLSDV